MIEPFATMLIGRWYMRCEHAKDQMELESNLQNFWFGARALNRIAIVCHDATHFSIAMNNEMKRIAEYIESKIGINPYDGEHPRFPTRG